MSDDERNGDWMQTFTGRAFWPVDPRADEICIEDIAHALSMICRYCGHVRTFYSVAQHSVLVARSASPENKLWALMHDASEAYIVDVPRPLKPSLPGYREIESRVMAAVCERFGMSPIEPPEIKRIDNAILADEAAQLMAVPPRDWNLPEAPLGIDIDPWSPIVAKAEFLEMFGNLTQMEPTWTKSSKSYLA